MKQLLLITGAVLSLGLSSACAKSASEMPTPATGKPETSSPAAVATQTTVPAATAPAENSKTGFSEGMQITVDGSSLEAFNKSLEMIKGKTEGTEYTALTGAIDYLLVYDLTAKRDRAKLAQRLNGLTGEQIVEKVQWNRRKPQRNQK